ncbi:hypothetical protein [Nostoc sp. UHCC 0251]|nr:hypothetical protein [Nostoc sp. UHCC 0251]MEA5625069.1 hypothetical protein [Nostoc sp. UHCC 0251]
MTNSLSSLLLNDLVQVGGNKPTVLLQPESLKLKPFDRRFPPIKN